MDKRTEHLVALMRETADGLTSRDLPPFPGEKLWLIDQEPDEWEDYCAGGPEPSWWPKPRKAPLMRPRNSFPGEVLTLEVALSRLGRVRSFQGSRGQQWRAKCPAHDTNHFSLVVSENDYKPGTPMFFCYAGCTHQAVKEAVEALP